MTPKEYKEMMDYLTRKGIQKPFTPASAIERPKEVLEIEAFKDFNERNPKADGGRIGFSEGTDNLTKAEKIAQGLEKKRVSTKVDTYLDALKEFRLAIKNVFDERDASLFPKPFAQFLKDKGLKEGTYAYLVKTNQLPKINTDVSDFRFQFANLLIDSSNQDLKFIDAEKLFKGAGFTDKDYKKVFSLKDKKLNKLDKAEDKIKKAYIRFFQDPFYKNANIKAFFNPRKILSGATGLNEETVSRKFDIKKFDPEGFELYKRLGNADIQKAITKKMNELGANPNEFTREGTLNYITKEIKTGYKPYSFYMGKESQYAATRKGRLETAAKKAGEGVAYINEAQDEVIELLNKHYKKNPEELLGNTKLRNLLDLTLEDGEIVKKNKYVSDDDFLKLIKRKKGLFTKDHVDEVQFEKLSTEFPIFRQLATYNTNSGLIKSMKAYVAKNQNSTDPVVQDKIKKQISFLEDLKLRIDTPTGRVGSKEVLAAVDREAGTLPNFLAQLRALNIKLPAKAKAVLLGTGGGLAATTLATAGPIGETGPTAMDTAKTVGAAGTGVAAVGTKTGRNILGKAFRTLGTRAAGSLFAADQVRRNIQSGENIADAVVDPLVGLELSFPGLFKENVAKITKNPILQRALNLGRFARFTTPVGAALGVAGLGVDAAKFTKKRIGELRAMTPQQRQDLRAEQSALAFEGAREGGLIGKESGPPPISGPTPHGDEGLPAAFKRDRKG